MQSSWLFRSPVLPKSIKSWKSFLPNFVNQSSTTFLLSKQSENAIRSFASEPHHGLFEKILIANRGEIACRVIRTAKKLGIKTVAVFSEADKHSMHVSMADEAYLIGPAPSRESYLRKDKIIEVAKKSGAQAIHPGYGFLSENAEFAEYCEKNGVTFIGPPPSAIRDMGSKSESKIIMSKAKVPLIPGYHGEDQSIPLLQKEAQRIGFPVLIKAVMGGGGKGMRIVENPGELEEAVKSAKREAINSFGDDRILIEKYILQPRHVEFQVFGDKFGNYVYLFERDCSVQRRYQKIIEEAPAPGMTPELRKRMGEAAVAAARAVGYVGAGTVEFIMDAKHDFYFMEMNTRLQVEHPITEMITKQDLVEWQLKVAANHKLPLKQEDLKIHGHAFESRIYAENPSNNFLPQTGKLIHLSTPPPAEFIRIDTGVREGDSVSVYYDPMIAKLAVWGPDRRSALQRMKVALEGYKVVGLPTNTNFLMKLASHPSFIAGDVETGFIPKHKDALLPPPQAIPNEGISLATLALLLKERNTQVENSVNSTDPFSPLGLGNGKRFNYELSREVSLKDGDREVKVNVTYNEDGSFVFQLANSSPIHAKGNLKGGEITAYLGDRLFSRVTVVINDLDLHVFYNGNNYTLRIPVKDYTGATSAKGSLLAPMPGRIIEVPVQIGQKVKKGESVMIMESMKMQYIIRSPVDGVVEKLNYKANDLVELNKQLLIIKENESK